MDQNKRIQIKQINDAQVNETLKSIREVLGQLDVEQTVSDGTRSILICSVLDEYGNRKYVNFPVFSSIYSAQEWARRDLYQR